MPDDLGEKLDILIKLQAHALIAQMEFSEREDFVSVESGIATGTHCRHRRNDRQPRQRHPLQRPQAVEGQVI